MRLSVLMAAMMSRALAFSPPAISDGWWGVSPEALAASDVAGVGGSSLAGSDSGGGLLGGTSKSEG
jgi:hypothetical protein